MHDLLSSPALLIAALALWFILQRFLLPRLGIGT